MTTSTLSKLSALLVASASLSSAARPLNEPRFAIMRRNITADDHPTAEFNDALDNHPNATGKWGTIGFDLTKPYAGESSNQTGWDLEIHVAAGLKPRSNSTTESNPARIYLRAPEDAFGEDNSSSIDPGWDTCAFTWIHELNDVKSVEELRNSDPDARCSKLLSDKCIQALKDAVKDAKCGSLVKVPGDCNNQIVTSGNNANGYGRDKGQLINDTRGSYTTFTSYPPYNQPGNASEAAAVYDYAVTTVWPVAISYIYNHPNGTNSTFSDFRCLQAKDIADGSRQPEGFGKRPQTSAAAGLAVPTAMWQMLSIGAFVGILMMI